MYKRIGLSIYVLAARAALASAIGATAVQASNMEQVQQSTRGKSGKVTHAKGNAAALKRASIKRNNIRKHKG